MFSRVFRTLIIGLMLGVLSGCVPEPPKHPINICLVFRQYPRWYMASKHAQRRWGVPISVQMAIIHQESHYRGNARPAREKILWVIPWARPSTAEGYAQAVNGTWRLYLKQTRRSHANRSNFASATDFIGWFGRRAHYKLGVRRDNAYALYLVYHEGVGGYLQKTYLRKPWLMRVATHVSMMAKRYQAQLQRCEASLPQPHWWQIF